MSINRREGGGGREKEKDGRTTNYVEQTNKRKHKQVM